MRWTLSSLANGAGTLVKRVSVLKVYGVTRMLFATGVKSASHDSVQKPSVTTVSGRTPRKSVAFTESLSSSMKKTPKFSQEDLRPHSTSVSWLMLSSSIATTLRTCPSIKFPKLILIR
jgi:hypothetical protein